MDILVNDAVKCAIAERADKMKMLDAHSKSNNVFRFPFLKRRIWVHEQRQYRSRRWREWKQLDLWRGIWLGL